MKTSASLSNHHVRHARAGSLLRHLFAAITMTLCFLSLRGFAQCGSKLRIASCNALAILSTCYQCIGGIARELLLGGSAARFRRYSVHVLLLVIAGGTAQNALAVDITIPATHGPWYFSASISGGDGTGGVLVLKACGAGASLEEAAAQVAAQQTQNLVQFFGPGYSLTVGSCTYLPAYTAIVDDYAGFAGQVCTPKSHDVQIGADGGLGAFCNLNENTPNNPSTQVKSVSSRHIECPAGTSYTTDSTGDIACAIRFDDVCKRGDPVSPVNGALFEEEIDYRSGSPNSLEFHRYYHSFGYYVPGYAASGHSAGGFTKFWSHSYAARVYPGDGTHLRLIAVRPDGTLWYFDTTGQELMNHSGTGAAAVSGDSQAGWTLTLANGDIESYDASGALISITTRAGFRTSINHDSVGNINTVVDAFGRTLTFGYDSHGRIGTVTDPSGGVITYQYGGDGEVEGIASVSYPDLTSKTYLYEEGRDLTLLTGILDENSQRYATYAYDDIGWATSSENAGGANRHQFIYTRLAGQSLTTQEIDPLGAVRTYISAEGSDHVVRSQSVQGGLCTSCGNAAVLAYDSQGNISDRKDFNDIHTVYAYDLARNLETQRTEAASTASARTITTQWHPTYRLPTLISTYSGGSATGTPVKTIAHTYDGAGNVLTDTVTDPATGESRTWTHTYNAIGQILTSDGPRTDVSDVTTYTYYTCQTGSECGQLHTVTDASGNVTTYNTYNANGLPTTVTDPNGVITTLTYDLRHRLLSRQIGNETTSFSYLPTGLLKQVTQPDGSFLLYTYDAAHRLIQINDGAGNKVIYTLDAMGNRTGENTYDPVGALHRAHTRIVNSFNELYQDVKSAGTAAVTTTFGYDGNGNETSISAPLQRNTASTFDALNRLQQNTDPARGSTQFSYNANDDMTSVIDPRGLTTSYNYNAFGELVTQTSPDTGTTTSTHDSVGNLVTSADARGAVATYTHDSLNRVRSVVYSLGGTTDQSLSFTYDSGTNGKGRLTGASDANHSMAWTYDGLGRIVTKSQTVAGITFHVNYAYANGNLATVTTPSGKSIAYSYNGNHQVTSVAVNGINLLSGVSYEPFGAVNGWTWGNGSLAERTFDADGNVTQVANAGVNTYSYDDAGRISTATDEISPDLSWLYDYDKLDRMTAATPGLGGGQTSTGVAYAYDANGNQTTQGSLSFSIAPGSNRLNNVSGGLTRSYSYDAAGNVTGFGPSITYNGAGRMVSFSQSGAVTTFSYNALGQRIRKTSGTGTTYFVYDESGHLMGEYDGTGALIQEIVWLGDTPVASVRLGSCGLSIFYIHTDWLNTPRKITRRSTSEIVWQWNSDPFGNGLPNENPSGLGAFSFNLRFPGQYYDAETGLHYNYFRDYDPVTGKYIQPDPIGLKGGIDPYVYVGDDAPNFVDPSGLAPPGRTAPSILPPGPFEFPTYGSPSNVQWAHDTALAIENWFREACKRDEKGDCLKEIEQCMKTCQRARKDPNQRNVWAGSWWRCLTGCVPFRCQKYIDEQQHGDPERK